MSITPRRDFLKLSSHIKMAKVIPWPLDSNAFQNLAFNASNCHAIGMDPNARLTAFQLSVPNTYLYPLHFGRQIFSDIAPFGKICEIESISVVTLQNFIEDYPTIEPRKRASKLTNWDTKSK